MTLNSFKLYPKCLVCNSETKYLFTVENNIYYRCIQKDCGLEFIWPQPTKTELELNYYKKYYNFQDNPLYKETSPILYQQILNLVTPEVKSFNQVRVLDFGCATGVLYSMLPNPWKETYIGVELNENARLAAHEYTDRPIFKSIDEALSHTQYNNKWNLVILNQVIEHIKNPIEALSKIRQGSIEKGILFVSTPNSNCLKRKLLRSRWSQYQNPTHLFAFNWKALQKCLIKAGWSRIIRCKKPLDYPNRTFHRKIFGSVLRAVYLDGNLTVIAQATK